MFNRMFDGQMYKKYRSCRKVKREFRWDQQRTDGSLIASSTTAKYAAKTKKLA